MRIGTNNIFQNTSMISNNKKPFAGAQINGTELFKTDKTKESDKAQEEKKPKSPLETLMAQRQKVTEQKYSLIGSTLEKGGDINNIKTQLEAYDEQIKAIDSQIASIMAEEMEKQKDKNIEKDSKEPKTEEEIETAKMLSIISNSNNVEQAEVVQSVKGELEGEAKVLTSEIAIDGSKLGGAIESKKQRLAEVEGKITSLEKDFANRLGNINTDIVKDNDGVIDTKESEETQYESLDETQDEAKNQEYPEIDVYA